MKNFHIYCVYYLKIHIIKSSYSKYCVISDLWGSNSNSATSHESAASQPGELCGPLPNSKMETLQSPQSAKPFFRPTTPHEMRRTACVVVLLVSITLLVEIRGTYFSLSASVYIIAGICGVSPWKELKPSQPILTPEGLERHSFLHYDGNLYLWVNSLRTK